MKGTCPKCGGPDGIMLFTDVWPCDRCYGQTSVVRSGKRRWELVMNDVMPKGTIAWEAWYSEHPALEYIKRPIPLGTPTKHTTYKDARAALPFLVFEGHSSKMCDPAAWPSYVGSKLWWVALVED